MQASLWALKTLLQRLFPLTATPSSQSCTTPAHHTAGTATRLPRLGEDLARNDAFPVLGTCGLGRRSEETSGQVAVTADLLGVTVPCG